MAEFKRGSVRDSKGGFTMNVWFGNECSCAIKETNEQSLKWLDRPKREN